MPSTKVGSGYLLRVVVTPNSLNGEFVRLVLLCGDKASGKRDTREDMKAPGKRRVAAGLVFRIHRGARRKLFTAATVEKNERKRGDGGERKTGRENKRKTERRRARNGARRARGRESGKGGGTWPDAKGRAFFPVTRLSRKNDDKKSCSRKHCGRVHSTVCVSDVFRPGGQHSAQG